MKHKSLFHRLLQNTRRPEGFLGRIILRSMNRGHAPLIAWGLTHLSWQPDWTVLDIGCGGGAALAEILRRCPQGKAYGVDASPESVAFARKTNRTDLDTRCFIRQGTAGHLPFGSDAFDAATAFETVYFWEDLPAAFADTCRTDHQRMNISGVNHGSGISGTADHNTLRKRDLLCLVLL